MNLGDLIGGLISLIGGLIPASGTNPSPGSGTNDAIVIEQTDSEKEECLESEDEVSSQELERRLDRLRSVSPRDLHQERGGEQSPTGDQKLEAPGMSLEGAQEEHSGLQPGAVPHCGAGHLSGSEVEDLSGRQRTGGVGREAHLPAVDQEVPARAAVPGGQDGYADEGEQEEQREGDNGTEERDHEEERDDVFLLGGRAQATIPPGRAGGREDQGRKAILRLGAKAAFLVQFTMLQDVDDQNKGVWCKAVCEVLKLWRAAECQEDRDCALMWFGFLPQCLQRKPSRGGKVGRAQVAYRYACVVEDKWEKLVELWEDDMSRQEDRRREKRTETEEERMPKQRREVLGYIHAGQIGRGMRRVTSNGVANAHDPQVKEQLRRKFPVREENMPASVPKVNPIESFSSLRESLLSLEPGKSPGSGGMRPEYLQVLGERMEDEEIALLEQFALTYTSGAHPDWFYRLWLTLQTVPLYKTVQQQDVRPLGIWHSLIRVMHGEVVAQSIGEIRSFLEPQQLGMSRSGAGKLVMSVSGMLELNPSFVCVKTDIHNCFNEQKRRAVLDVISEAPQLSDLTTFAAAVLSPEVDLEAGGESLGNLTYWGSPRGSSIRCLSRNWPPALTGGAGQGVWSWRRDGQGRS